MPNINKSKTEPYKEVKMYILMIKKEVIRAVGTLADIEKELKTEFKSYDYMVGFLDGYLFGKYKLITVKKV